MSDNKRESTKKPLTLSTSPLATKKPMGTMSQVRQSFSHGRSKTVMVEIKKARQVRRLSPQSKEEETPLSPDQDLALSSKLTMGEKGTRLRVLQEALHEETVAATQPTIITSEERNELVEPSPEEIIVETRSAPPLNTPHKRTVPPVFSEEKKKPHKTEARRPVTIAQRHTERASLKKVSIDQALEGEDSARRRPTSGRKASKKKASVTMMTPSQKIVREVILPGTITVQDLAARMAERGADVIKTLMNMGIVVKITQAIDVDTAELVVEALGHRSVRTSNPDLELSLQNQDDDVNDQKVPRGPIVTVMGHVDHGKTSLLDALRHTNVAAGEAGGITQHIGAYQVQHPNSPTALTFIDTPGHAAFNQMRARGAQITDIIVLVVAADDGVKEQTIEAIQHAKTAQVPLIVAINKIDKPAANPQGVRQMLLAHDVFLEEMGGDVLSVEISAKTKLNLDKLIETILLQAEVLDLKANPARPAQGFVIEAQIKKGKGATATVIIQTGSLKIADAIVIGQQHGRVRDMIDHRGQKISRAGPSVPVEISGLSATPQAGDLLSVVSTEVQAREIAEFRQQKAREQDTTSPVSAKAIEAFFAQKASKDKITELLVILKSDAQGALEALSNGLKKISNDEIRIRILQTGIGAITETDVLLAKGSQALILGFNVRANPQARTIAQHEKVDIRYHSVIYHAVDDIKSVLSGLLAPTLRETFLGRAEVRKIFTITKVGKIAGCMVTAGTIKRGAHVRLIRAKRTVYEGLLKTLKREKDELKEAREGYECGMNLENCDNLQEGDIIECFDVEQVQRVL